MEPQLPRVFISYRNGETEHETWVVNFVRQLERREVLVLFQQYEEGRQKNTLFLAKGGSQKEGEITRMVHLMAGCHVFMPIFTPEYLEGIAYPEGRPVDRSSKVGWVFDEFQLSLGLGSERRIETVPILRQGELDKLPPGFDAGNTLDLRTEIDYAKKLNFLAAYLKDSRAVKFVPEIEGMRRFFRHEYPDA